MLQEYFKSAFRRLVGSEPQVAQLAAAEVIEVCDRRVQLTSDWRAVWRVASLLTDRTTATTAEILAEYTRLYEPNFCVDVGQYSYSLHNTSLSSFELTFIDIHYITFQVPRIEINLSTPGLEGMAEFLRAYCSVFLEVQGGWGLCAGVVVSHCRELRPPEDYSVHDTPPGQKVSTTMINKM